MSERSKRILENALQMCGDQKKLKDVTHYVLTASGTDSGSPIENTENITSLNGKDYTEITGVLADCGTSEEPATQTTEERVAIEICGAQDVVETNIMAKCEQYGLIRPSTSMTDSFSEDSDDSVQDQDYIVSSEFSSESEEVNDDFLNLDENDLSQKLSEERHNWKGRPKRGRRNKYPGQTSRSRKRLKDSNQSYYSVKGKLNESKPFLRNFQCQCAKKCHEVVSEEMREVLFKKYWDLGSYDLQTSFIGTTVQQFPVKRKRTKIVEGKSFTRVLSTKQH
nr:unnamed protein product [Callosobruchus chinensis]